MWVIIFEDQAIFSQFPRVQVTSMTDFINMLESLKLQSSHILDGICSLIGCLRLLHGAAKDADVAYSVSEEVSDWLCLYSLSMSKSLMFEICNMNTVHLGHPLVFSICIK